MRLAHSNQLLTQLIVREYFDAVLDLRLINVQFTL
jgi:hypothetical protein